MCTHNLCFGAKLRKIGIHLHIPVSLYVYKSGVKVFFIACRCFPDGVYTGTHTKNCIQIKKKKVIYIYVCYISCLNHM